MKKKLIVIIAVVTLLFALAVAFAIGAGAEEAEPILSIGGKSLVMESSVNIRYLVSAQNVANIHDVKVLVWADPQESYVKGTELAEVEWVEGNINNNGVTYYYYEFDGVAAKMLADDFYAVVYTKVGDKEYYSTPDKYSVLKYSYNMMGKLDKAASTNTDLLNMLEVMLDYGASAQHYFKYKTDRLANMDFYQVKTVGGTLPDGFTDGLYLENENVTITAAAPAEGYEFVGWQKGSTGKIVSTDMTTTVTVGTANEVYIAVYDKAYSKGLDFISYDGGNTYLVSAKGACKDTCVIIPRTYNRAPVTGIDVFAFAYDPSVEKIILPASIQTLGEWALVGCANLTEIEVDEANEAYKSVGGVLYTKDGKTLVQYPIGKGDSEFEILDGTVDIGECAAVDGLFTSVTIPASVKTIGISAFDGCSSLSDVFYGDTKSAWGNIAIESGNDFLVNAELHAVISYSVGLTFKPTSDNKAYILSGIGTCEDEDILIPDTYNEKPVVSISSNAFAGSEIKSIIISENITAISDGAFSDCELLETIEVNKDNTAYSSVDGNLYNAAGTKLLRYAPGKKGASFILPENVTEIGSEAFSGCESISAIAIGASVNVIGERAFAYCPSLTSISVDSLNAEFSSTDGSLYNKNRTTIIAYSGNTSSFDVPNDVIEIGAYAFVGRTELETVSIPDTVEKIGMAAFKGCTALDNVVIPDGVWAIETYAFADCASLSEITLGELVYTIGGYAFSGCTSLDVVNYNKHEEAFEEIVIGSGNEALTSATLIFVNNDKTFEVITGDTPIIGLNL